MISITKRSLPRSRFAAALFAMVLGGVVMGAGRTAYSYGWVHPLNGPELLYFMPGGPEESFLTGCIVGTRLLKDRSGDRANLTAFRGLVQGLSSNRSIGNAVIQIITLNQKTGLLEEGPRVVTGPARKVFNSDLSNDYTAADAISVGAEGQPIVGAHVCAINLNGLIRCWDITVF